jgi:hypothetical protein
MNRLLAALCAAFFFLIAAWLFDLIMIIQIMLWSVAVIVVASGIVVSVLYIKIKQAEQKAASYEAKAKKYVIEKDGFGMLYALNLKTNIVENWTANPTTHHNGKWEQPRPEQMAGWLAVINKGKGELPAKVLLPEPQQTIIQQLDLMTIFTQPGQSYAIIAGQQVGKTYQAMQIANYWQSQGNQPIVIGPKWDKGEWAGCKTVGGRYNWDAIRFGLQTISDIARERHGDKVKSHKQHLLLPVFFDDWTSIRAQVESADSFILEATTLYASVNIVLYFILHLDTANAWGVGKVGAALKNNFVKLFIEPGYNEQGLLNRQMNKGFLMRPGDMKKDRVPIKLFGGSAVANPDSDFVQLVRSGASRQEASVRAYQKDYAGTSHVYRCKRLLGE